MESLLTSWSDYKIGCYGSRTSRRTEKIGLPKRLRRQMIQKFSLSRLTGIVQNCPCMHDLICKSYLLWQPGKERLLQCLLCFLYK